MDRLKIVPRMMSVVRFVGVLLWLGTICLYWHYDDTRPTLMMPAEGRLSAWNEHGHVFYLTLNEELRMYALLGAGAVLFGIAGTVEFYAKLYKKPYKW
jgi:hypothetical protein